MPTGSPVALKTNGVPSGSDEVIENETLSFSAFVRSAADAAGGRLTLVTSQVKVRVVVF